MANSGSLKPLMTDAEKEIWLGEPFRMTEAEKENWLGELQLINRRNETAAELRAEYENRRQLQGVAQ